MGSSGELGQGGGELECWLPQLVVETNTQAIVAVSAGDNHSSAITGYAQKNDINLSIKLYNGVVTYRLKLQISLKYDKETNVSSTKYCGTVIVSKTFKVYFQGI